MYDDKGPQLDSDVGSAATERHPVSKAAQLARHAARQRAYRARRRAKGLCATGGCPETPVPGYTLCRWCRVEEKARLADLGARRKANGQCITCGAGVRGDHVRCWRCRKRAREFARHVAQPAPTPEERDARFRETLMGIGQRA